MSVSGLFHVGINASDVDEELPSYRDPLGLEVVSDGASCGPSAERPSVCRAAGSGWCSSASLPAIRSWSCSTPSTWSATRGTRCRPTTARGTSARTATTMPRVFTRAVEHGFTAHGGEEIAIDRGPRSGSRIAYLIDPDGCHVETDESPVRQ